MFSFPLHRDVRKREMFAINVANKANLEESISPIDKQFINTFEQELKEHHILKTALTKLCGNFAGEVSIERREKGRGISREVRKFCFSHRHIFAKNIEKHQAMSFKLRLN